MNPRLRKAAQAAERLGDRAGIEVRRTNMAFAREDGMFQRSHDFATEQQAARDVRGLGLLSAVAFAAWR